MEWKLFYDFPCWFVPNANEDDEVDESMCSKSLNWCKKASVKFNDLFLCLKETLATFL